MPGLSRCTCSDEPLEAETASLSQTTCKLRTSAKLAAESNLRGKRNARRHTAAFHARCNGNANRQVR